ncbi:NAD(P)/FAD-dependent oxidoreductase [Devosia sp. RR2S18]|uniref:NAD(P)/FAD-dependent oxidoreductase n=1 Tax=Devosia rhizosphaerae TaxID=3049774 RepID=UPI002540A50A|nr:FAD-binding oxidoreductase [Devosia sp. RR2S18]WIJ25107.1 FAD-binding oxidoreductase [Devosia sp. RR2S18]
MTLQAQAQVHYEQDLATSADVLVVGAGVIGTSCAFALQAAGRSVLVIDPKGVAGETSAGNAGAFAFSDIIPLATKGMLAKVPRWLADPLGPLTIPPRYLPQVTPWLIRFWRAGWPDKIQASIRAQAEMMRLSQAATDWLVQEAGIGSKVGTTGSLELYESENEYRASLPAWAEREKQDIAFEHVQGTALAEVQPGLSDRFYAGTLVPQWRMVDDPYSYTVAIAAAAQARGAKFALGAVNSVRRSGEGTEVSLQDGRTLAARQVVIAGGAWSNKLTTQLGDRIPLETERGYNTTLPSGAIELKRQLIFGGHGFVISPLEIGVRIGGAVELGGLNIGPNFARADAMLKKAKAFLPDLKIEGGKQWMGYRPSLPDSLPAIGHSRAGADIVYAFGHGHLGLTQSAGTARLVTQLLNREAPSIDLTPFRPQRFALFAR